MARIKNMGTATMKFSEGAIITGSAGVDQFSLVVSGSTATLDSVIVGGRLGVDGITDPNESLSIDGSMSFKEQINSDLPSHTSNFGKIYVKQSDSKLYFKDDSGNEYNLTDSSGGNSAEFAIGHVDLTTNNKPVNWINASSISASSGIKSWFIVPRDTTIDKVIVSVKANNFDTANDGNITLSIFKNQPDYNSTIVNTTVAADDFTEKVSNMAGGTTDCNQKVFTGLNQAVSEGDLIHIKVGKSAGSDREALVTLVFDSSANASAKNKTAVMARAQAIPAAGSDGWVFAFGDGAGNAATASDANNRDTIYVVPHDGTVKDLILTVHQGLFQTSTYGNITLAVYKNPVEFDSGAKFIDLTTDADSFAGKSRLIGFTHTFYARQKNFADLFSGNTFTVSKGDILQVTINGSTGTSYSSLDITLSLVIEET